MAPTRHLVCALVLAATAAAAQAQRPIAYPSQGQSQARQDRDDGECHTWARKQTGIDPAAVASQPPPQETGPAVGGGERVRGALRGALGGAAIGAIGGDAGEGAAIGAGVGTIAGGHRARQNQADRNAASAGAQQAAIDEYRRAYHACMRGRGYTVE
ncbi:glycine zipper family protein [Massilia timonae]|uniref:glycine zipper family protein n=1 Tax=Massilia timonae TaxID=47229 RepID=UPI00289A7D09|nr:glycine zipper family protein [Massilia timonae]